MILNTNQQAVVKSCEKKILCLAGAGTGKTQVMISKMIYLVKNGVDPESILGLTFTNAAAGEMLSRYIRLSQNQLSSTKNPRFQTFHAFCYSLICKDANIRAYLGYSTIPTIISEGEYKILQKKSKMKVGLKVSDSMLNNPSSISGKDKFTYQAFQKDLSRVLKTRNLITFDMMSNVICKMFVEQDALVLKYITKYKYIFIDEFQDTDKLQYQFAAAFKESCLFFVGDALQALYSFRNADSSIIKSLAVNPEWKVYKLDENYRSTVQICSFANSMSIYADASYRIPLVAHSSGPEVDVIKSTVFRSYEVAANVHDILAKRSGSVAILCRSNSVVSEIQEALDDEGIFYSSKQEKSEIAECIDSLKNKCCMLNWLVASLSSEEMVSWIRFSFSVIDEEFKFEEFLRRYSNNPEIVRKLSKIRTVEKYIQEHSLDINGENIIEKIRFIEHNSIGSSSRLYVGTIHSAKGLEYDNVILPDVGSSRFKLNNEDNLNCYYVAITRAKNYLCVFQYNA